MLEVCIDRVDAVQACVAGGADRIELCAALALGGLTATSGAMRRAARSALPVHALIRPRCGDFVYDDADIEQMCHDIGAARDAGLAGVVIGAATTTGRLDIPALQRLLRAADGLSSTLHRVVDTLDDPVAAVELAIELGIDCILSSGGAVRAVDGLATLAAMQTIAAGRIRIMAGAGIEADAVPAIAQATGIRAYHGSCSRPIGAEQRLVALGFAASTRRVTDVACVAAMHGAVCQPVTVRHPPGRRP